LLGEEGFKNLARLNHEAACQLADALDAIDGVRVINENFFNEFTIELNKPSHGVVQALANKGIIAGLATGTNNIILAATEMTTDADIAALVEGLKNA
jgi:glycine dehydrogenase subunit 1